VPVATLEIDPNDGRITLMSVRARVHTTFDCRHNNFPVLIFPSHPSGERPIPRRRHQLQRSVPVGREQARGKVAAGETPPTLHPNTPKTKLKTCIHKPLQRHKNWSSGGDCRITAVSCSFDGKCAPPPPPLATKPFFRTKRRPRRYVSILSQRSADGVLWTPDSRVCVWFVETEVFNFYDVGAGMEPIAQFWDAVDARLLGVHCMRHPGQAAAAAAAADADDSSDADSHQQRMV